MTDNENPKIRFDMPPVEGFGSAVAMVRATGARGDGGRSFVIEGPMTTAQVFALIQLLDWQWDGVTLTLTFDPDEPWPPDEWISEADQWWAEQGRGTAGS